MDVDVDDAENIENIPAIDPAKMRAAPLVTIGKTTENHCFTSYFFLTILMLKSLKSAL